MNLFKKCNDSKYIYWGLHVIVAIFYVLYFFVILQSCFSADDIFNSNAAGCNYIPNDSVWKLTVRQWGVWFSTGRFFPFSNYVYILFAVTGNVFNYKLFLMVLVYINSILMGRILYKMTQNRAVEFLVMMLFPVSIQLTPIYDGPLYCYHGLMQIVLLGSEIAVLCVFKYCDNVAEKNKKSVWLLILGAFCYMIALGTYEVAFIMAAFIGLCTWCYTKSVKKSLKVLIPHIIVYIFMLVMNVVMRMYFAGSSYNGTTINLDIEVVGVTFFKQLVSTFPFAGLIYSINAGGEWDVKLWLDNLNFTDIFMVILFITIMVIVVINIKKKDISLRSLVFLLFTGLSLMIFPSLLIAVTEKYQQELIWGKGHLVNYIQNFGLAILVTSLIVIVLRKCNKVCSIIFTSLLLIIYVPVLIGQQAQARVDLEIVYNVYGYKRDIALNAVKDGVLDEVGSDDKLFGYSSSIFDNAETRQFYTFASKRYIQGFEANQFVGYLKESYGVKEFYDNIDNVYVADTFANKNGAYTIVGKCYGVAMDISQEVCSNIYVVNPRIYVSGVVPFDYSEWSEIKVTENGTLYEYDGVIEMPYN